MGEFTMVYAASLLPLVAVTALVSLSAGKQSNLSHRDAPGKFKNLQGYDCRTSDDVGYSKTSDFNVCQWLCANNAQRCKAVMFDGPTGMDGTEGKGTCVMLRKTETLPKKKCKKGTSFSTWRYSAPGKNTKNKNKKKNK